MTSEKHAIWPALERNRALIGLPFSGLAIALSLYSLYLASLSNARSGETANRMAELSHGSFVELKQQTSESHRQTFVLSQQLDAQRRLTDQTASQLNDVVSGLSSQVSYLSQQTEALRSLVQRSEENSAFSTKAFGWWRNAPTSTSADLGLAALAFSTLRSSQAAWPEKENALAFLSDYSIPADGIISRDLLIETTVFENKNMRNSDFTNSSLSNVIFAPSSDHYQLNLQGSRFNNAAMWNLKISSADMTNTSFHGATIRMSQLQSVALANADLTGATLENVSIQGDMRNSTLNGSNLSNVSLECHAFFSCGPSPLALNNTVYRWAIDFYSAFSTLDFYSGEVAHALPDRTVPAIRNSSLSNFRISNSYPLYRFELISSFVRNSSFAGQVIMNSDFTGSTFSNTSFRNAILRDVDASAATFNGVDFEGARLQGVDLSGALFSTERELAGATLENVLVDAGDLFRLQGAKLGADDVGANKTYLYILETGDLDPEDIVNLIRISGTCGARGFGGFKIVTDKKPDRVIESELGRRLVIDLPGGLLKSKISGLFGVTSVTPFTPPPCGPSGDRPT